MSFMNAKYLPEDDEAREHPLAKRYRWTLQIVSDDGSRRIYDAEPPKRKNSPCPDCETTASPKEYYWSEKNYEDVKRKGKEVALRVRHRRLECPNEKCKTQTFVEDIPELNHRHLTRALADELIEAFRLHRGFSSTAREHGLKEQTLRNLEADYVAERDGDRRNNHTLSIPLKLGMHSVRIAERYRCLLIDVTSGKPLEFIRSQSPGEIIGTIVKLFAEPELGKVELVVMGIDDRYREVVATLFPQAKIIVPMFEVGAILARNAGAIIKRVGMKVSLSREERELAEGLLRGSVIRLADEGKQIEDRLGRSDVFRAAYEMRKGFLELRACPIPQRVSRYRAWAEAADRGLPMVSSPLFRSTEEWEGPILEGLEFHTNDYLDQVERLISWIKKFGPWYSFETIRGRLLYALPTREMYREDSPRYSKDEESYDEEFQDGYDSAIKMLIDFLESEFSGLPQEITSCASSKFSLDAVTTAADH